MEYDQLYERNQMGWAKRMSKWAFAEKSQLKEESQGLEGVIGPLRLGRHGVRKIESHVSLEGSMAGEAKDGASIDDARVQPENCATDKASGCLFRLGFIKAMMKCR